MQDQILDIDGGYGRKLLVDFEQATFNNWDEEIDISHRVDFWNDGDDTGFELKGSFLDDTFVFDQEKFTYLVNQNVNEINIRDGAGNDTNIILSKQLSVNINLDIGDDYVYLGEELGVSLPADNWYQVDLRTYDSSRFNIEQVSVVVDDQYRVAKDGSGNWLLANATDANAQEALLITDVLTTGSDLGSNLIVGIDRVRFLDGELRTGVTESTYTQDDNGIIFIEIQQHGSAFGERLSFKVDSNGTVMDVNNNLRGNGGNDTLIGAMNGDILNGGLGDDLLIGAGNGDSANEWRDLDRAEYDVSTWARLTVDGVRVGYDHTSHTLLLDANGDILFNPNSTQLTGTGYQLTSAYQVTDVVSSDQGGFGSDILIGVERLSITGSEINLGVTTQLHDWDSDGSVDNAEVRGSDFNDTILSVLEGGDVEDAAFLARSNNINAEGGDDNVYAGAGGDWIRLGTGNDFVDGGSNDGTNNWGGANIDQVRFNNNQANYTLSSTSFDGTEHLLHDLDGLLVFKVQADGQIMRMSTTGDTQLLGQVLQGEKFTLVQDKTPSGELAGEGTNLLIGIEELSFNDNWMRLQQDIGVRYNQDGDVQNGWTNGTGISDTMVGHSYSDEFNGEAGDDLMVGAGGGDRFNGGAGDDIMLGGANGTTGNDWDDLDRADYWQFDSQRAVITKVKVGMHSDGSNLLLDTDNNLILAPSNQLLGSNYQLVDAYQVMDIVADNYGGFGTDTLVGIERIYFKDSQVDLLISTQERDWNNDGLTDWTQVSGTNMADTIGLVSQGGTIASTSFMNASNYIRSGDGDDSIWAMSGDDTIRPEGGNDYINGGNLKDTVEFSGAESRYVITNYTFNDQEIDIIDSSGTAVFKVLNDGSVLRVNSDGTTTTLDTITSGQKLTQVADLMPGGILGGDGTNLMINVENIGFKGSHMSLEVDRNLNYNNGVLQNSWINGTHGNDSASDLMGTIVGDSINGNAGDDVLVGLQGNDRLRGGAGDDILWGDIEGSATSLPGRDEAQYNGVEGQFTITKGEHTVNGVVLQYVQVSDALSATLGGEGTDTLYGIEALNFTDSWVRIGVELYQHADDNGTVTYRHYQGSQFADTITGSEIGDNITGGQGNDLIYGGVGGDRIAGGEGSDIIYGGEEGIDAWGNARVDVAVFKGNWIDYSIQHWNASGQLSGTYDTAGHMTIQLVTTDNTGAVDTLYGIERLEFDDRSMSFKSSQNFTDANGDGVPDWAEIRGTDSADTIDGSAMADVIYGDAGDDILNGNTGNDQLSGDAGNDTIDGGSGQDVFGNSYVDTAIYTGNYAEYVITTADNVTWTVSANGETDTLSNIEVLRFADMSANLVGDVSTRDYNKDGIVDFANLAGTLGNDTFDVTNTDGFSASGWAPPDHLTSLDYYIALGDGNDNATLGSGNDTIKDLLGSDNYDGGSGFDTLQLSALWSEWSVTNNGDNTYSVAQLDGSTSNNKVISNIEQVQFNDRIITLVATSNALDIDQDGTADNMIYTGSDTDDVLNAAENMSISWQLNGNMGDDIISGSDVGDRLNGGTGNDTLSGGLGHDIAIYGSLAEQSTISQVVMIDDGSGNLIEDIAVTPTGTTHGYKVVSGLDEDSQTDYLIDIEGIEFSDGVVSLVNTEQILSSFSLTNGIQETRYEQGTRYDDDLTTSAYIDQLTGGTGNDTFNIIESGFQYSHITDFEGLDSDGGVHDLLTFNSTDDNSLFGVDVSTWASTDAAGKSDIIANLLKMATFDSASGNATFNFANHTLTLDNTTANDLSANNIDIV
jgi:Ca2+-binding RTX toxin-like protein